MSHVQDCRENEDDSSTEKVTFMGCYLGIPKFLNDFFLLCGARDYGMVNKVKKNGRP